MRVGILALGIAAALAPLGVNATVPKSMIGEIAERVYQDYRVGGMQNLSMSLQECYRVSRTKNKIARCVIYDIVAHKIDTEFRQDQIGGDPGPTVNYFSDDAVSLRVDKFADTYLGGSKALFSDYFGTAITQTERKVAYLFAHSPPL